MNKFSYLETLTEEERFSRAEKCREDDENREMSKRTIFYAPMNVVFTFFYSYVAALVSLIYDKELTWYYLIIKAIVMSVIATITVALFKTVFAAIYSYSDNRPAKWYSYLIAFALITAILLFSLKYNNLIF